MKKILLLFLVLSAFGLNAQVSTFFTEDFSGGIPVDWTVVDNDGLNPASNVAALGGTWWVSSTAAPENRAALSSSWYSPAGKSDDWLITPGIAVPTAGDPSNKVFLTWTGRAIDANYPDGYNVMLSTTGNALADFTVTLLDIAREETEEIKRSIDLTAYQGQTIYLAWVNDSNDQYILEIDDIAIAEYIPTRMSSVANLSRGYVHEADGAGISAQFVSEGHQTVASLDVNYIIDGGPVQSGTVSGLDVGLFGTAVFGTTSNVMLPAGLHSISMWCSNLNGVMDPALNSDTISFDVSIMATTDGVDRTPFVETFTSSTCAPCKPGNENLHNILNGMAAEDLPVSIKWQQNFPGTGDPYCTDESVSRRGVFGVNSIPRTVIDGNKFNDNTASVTANIINNAKSDLGFVDLDAYYSLTPDSQFVKVWGTYTVKSVILADTRLYVAVKENRTVQNVKSNGETEFFDVHKKTLPSEDGMVIPMSTPIGVSQAFGFEYTFNGNYRLPADGATANRINHAVEHSVEDFANLSAVAWVEYPTDLYILNASEAVEETTSLTSTNTFEGEVNVFPNPATDVVNISVDFEESTEVTVSVTDITGKQVAVVANALQVNAGVQNFVWNTNTAEGVYLVNIRTQQGEITKRVSVIK